MFTNALAKISSIVGAIFDKTTRLIEFIFTETFVLAEWCFKVGTRLLLLYLLYELVVGDLLKTILESL
jgi:hypothetical protein